MEEEHWVYDWDTHKWVTEDYYIEKKGMVFAYEIKPYINTHDGDNYDLTDEWNW